MEIQDADYFEYRIATGEWTEEQKLHWEFLLTIVKLLSNLNMNNSFGPDLSKKELIGSYMPHTQTVERHIPTS